MYIHHHLHPGMRKHESDLIQAPIVHSLNPASSSSEGFSPSTQRQMKADILGSREKAFQIPSVSDSFYEAHRGESILSQIVNSRYHSSELTTTQ